MMDHGPAGDYTLQQLDNLLDDTMPQTQGCLGCGGQCCKHRRYPPMRSATMGEPSEYMMLCATLIDRGRQTESDALIDLIEEAQQHRDDLDWFRQGECLFNANGQCTINDIKPAECVEFETGAGTPGPAPPGEETCISIRHAMHAELSGR